MIHAFASMLHYGDHLHPIWRRLNPDVRGRFVVGQLHELGNVASDDIVLVASGMDSARLRHVRKVYVEHGAGQSYNGDARSRGILGYSGAADKHENVVAFLCPRQDVADSWGDAETHVVGCPKLSDIVPTRDDNNPVAVITFHFPSDVCPEAGSAFAWWRESLPDIAAWADLHGYRLYGHAHPRWMGELWNNYDTFGIPTMVNAADVLTKAHLVIADNSSLAYEAAALGAEVISINAPTWRRDIEHGLRFWQHVPGAMYDTIDNLCEHEPLGPGLFDWASLAAAEYAYGGIPPGVSAAMAARVVTEIHARG